MKDWRGNTQSVMATLNASSHSNKSREIYDYYATPKKAVEELLKKEVFHKDIWECACGEGHISRVLESSGYNVFSTDLIDRGFGNGCVDFLNDPVSWNGDIITNPPFRYATEFTKTALSILKEGCKLALFLRIQYLESVGRYIDIFSKEPPKTIYCSVRTLRCAKNGDFEKATGNACTYVWVVWEKGFKGETTFKWFNYNK